jgi:hypothetical protein
MKRNALRAEIGELGLSYKSKYTQELRDLLRKHHMTVWWASQDSTRSAMETTSFPNAAEGEESTDSPCESTVSSYRMCISYCRQCL